MISKMFIVLYILVQIYFRLALCLYLEQGIYLLHSVLSFYSFFGGGGGGVMQWYQFTHFVAVVWTGNTVMFYTLLLDSSKIAV